MLFQKPTIQKKIKTVEEKTFEIYFMELFLSGLEYFVEMS